MNKEYVRQGDVQPAKLLTTAEVTEQVNVVYESIMQQIQEALAFIDQPEINEDQCSCLRKTRSNHCDNFNYFNTSLPEHPVYELKRITEKKLNTLLDAKQYDLCEVPVDADLNDSQKAQVTSMKQREPLVNWIAIKTKLEALEFPLHFFDYETYASAVPKMDGLRPHEQLPFQVSIHSLSKNGTIHHYEYLAETFGMPDKMVEGNA